MLQLKIGTSWVRGVVGEALTPELTVDFSSAFGTWADGGPIVIGRDPRRSSTMLRAAVISGLLSPGCEVLDLGLCPTPLVSFATRELGAAGGLSITGSHNTAKWNALKFLGPDGSLLNAVKSEELFDIYHAFAFRKAPRDTLQSVVGAPGITDRYLEHVLSVLDVDGIRKRRFRVAVDFCNGSCAPLMERFLGALSATLLPLNDRPSGQFAHAPAPSIATMGELVELVRCQGADLGAAVNVDGDRIAFVLRGGIPLSEEYTLPIAAQNRLTRRLGSIVTNLSTSRMVDEVARRHGQEVFRTSVGEGHVMHFGLEEGAVLAGEGSGGVGPLPLTMTFDAVLTLGVVLEWMTVSDSDLVGLVDGLPRFVMRKGQLRSSPDRIYRALDSFRTAFSARTPDLSDGVRVEWDDAWLHVRASNTEPLLRIIVEAETERRAEEVFEDAMAHARAARDSKGNT